jgi:hypothetical protein
MAICHGACDVFEFAADRERLVEGDLHQETVMGDG